MKWKLVHLWMAIVLAMVAVAGSAPQPVRAIGSILHVIPTGGATSGPCTAADWTDACDLQYALSIAAADDQVWVAEGTYKPGSSRSDFFNILPDVQVYGGFDGTEGTLSERDWLSNATILSGEIGTAAETDNIYTIVLINASAAAPVTD